MFQKSKKKKEEEEDGKDLKIVWNMENICELLLCERQIDKTGRNERRKRRKK